MLPLPEGKASQKYCTLGMGASGPWVGMLVYITSPAHAQPLSSFQVEPTFSMKIVKSSLLEFAKAIGTSPNKTERECLAALHVLLSVKPQQQAPTTRHTLSSHEPRRALEARHWMSGP